MFVVMLLNVGMVLTVTSMNASAPEYVRKINGFEFEGISTLQQPPEVEIAVWYIQEDITEAGTFLFSDGATLKTFNPVSQKESIIVGSNLSPSYQEGVYMDASFSTITGFTQVNLTHIVIVDSLNHCLRFVSRATRQTSTYAGLCEEPGYREGEGTLARFNTPHQAVMVDSSIFVTDYENFAIRMINLSTSLVSTFDYLTQQPIAIALNNRRLFISTPSSLLRINLDTNEQRYIIESTTLGLNDGAFRNAQINRPNSLLILSKDTVLLAESGNSRLRVVDLVLKDISTICKKGRDTFEDGNLKNCRLVQPLALARLNEGSIFIGTNSTESRQLTFTFEQEEESTDSATTETTKQPSSNNDVVVLTTGVVAAILITGLGIGILLFVINWRKNKRMKKMVGSCEKRIENQIKKKVEAEIQEANKMKHMLSVEETNGGIAQERGVHDEYADIDETSIYEIVEETDIDCSSQIGCEGSTDTCHRDKIPSRQGSLPKTPSKNIEDNSNERDVKSGSRKLSTEENLGYVEFDKDSSIHCKA
ncbi:uncharacterized protein [Watersipora subatra]|uniref:uncharacterized protein n=1 Tax=Watersipora subatra TaxID=2589382 RepID=UPI00355C50BF